VERRTFLRGSATGAGALIAGLVPEALKADPAGPPREPVSSGTVSAKLVEVPGTSYEVIDTLTTAPVTITLGKFLISPFEITQREFEEIMEYNPSYHRSADLPVETVTWWDAIRYCNLRSAKENLDPCYDLTTGDCDIRKNGYRLPTDAEWTHAAGGELTPPVENQPANLGGPDIVRVDLLLQVLKTSGTKPVGSYAPNGYGLYDMLGNVWEWCNDYFNPVQTPPASYNPTGPLRGLARTVRGGSFVSTTSSWARGYRSSMEPEYKSRFTGFRVCRTVEPKAVLPAAHLDPKWHDTYLQPPAGYENATGGLSSLVAGVRTVEEWETRRNEITAKWSNLLGSMEMSPLVPATRLVETVTDQNYTARLMYLQVEPDAWEKILVMIPPEALVRPRPVVIVPFYDVDPPAGRDLSGRRFASTGIESFAYMAVQKGYIAVAIRWFGESYGESYNEAVANLKLRHPHCTGLGKWVWDAHRLLDYLYTLPEVDRHHVGIIGHSLGGKMSLYAAAFDDRITAVVSNECGIGLTFSNYDYYWYFGDFIDKVAKGTDHHELIGLIAPRPFLLIGGDKFDTAESWHYINAAREVYKLYDKPLHLGYFNHHKGHTPTPEANWRSMEWLAHFLGTED
jgi:formylglycine-generating enzyme required for sulfatase activity/pimeloyl-ACP methyl ester carboxylesterase